jgi:hypothetical protein
MAGLSSAALTLTLEALVVRPPNMKVACTCWFRCGHTHQRACSLKRWHGMAHRLGQQPLAMCSYATLLCMDGKHALAGNESLDKAEVVMLQCNPWQVVEVELCGVGRGEGWRLSYTAIIVLRSGTNDMPTRKTCNGACFAFATQLAESSCAAFDSSGSSASSTNSGGTAP